MSDTTDVSRERDDNVAMIPVIEHHLMEAVRLMKASGEGPSMKIWYELEVFMPKLEDKRDAMAL